MSRARPSYDYFEHKANNVPDMPVEELRRWNSQHDRNYGWSYHFPNHYTNIFRLPESELAKDRSLQNGSNVVDLRTI